MGIKRVLLIVGVLGLLYFALSGFSGPAAAQQESLQQVAITGTGKVVEVSGSQIVISGVKNEVKVTNDDVKQITVTGVDNTVIYRAGANPRILDSGVNTKIRQYQG